MEPENTARAIAEWGLDYVVITSVDRDGEGRREGGGRERGESEGRRREGEGGWKEGMGTRNNLKCSFFDVPYLRLG